MKTLGIIVSTLLVAIILFFGVTPMGKGVWNNWFYNVQKVDDVTNYETIKKVEDTARGMIASYKADALKYEQYSGSSDPKQKEWGEQAKMRANTTATTYNEYILKNSFVWQKNIPGDILMQLPYIK